MPAGPTDMAIDAIAEAVEQAQFAQLSIGDFLQEARSAWLEARKQEIKYEVAEWVDLLKEDTSSCLVQ